MDHIKLELVKIARDLCFTEYTDSRAQLHNKWLVESEHLWRSQRLRLAYPDMPAYPTESDIMTRAEKLYDFVRQNPLKNTVTTMTSMPDTVPETVSETVSEKASETVSLPEPEPEPEPVKKTTPESSVREPEPAIVVDIHKNVNELKSSEGSGEAVVTTIQEKPKTSEEKRQEAEAKLLELIKEQSKLQTGLGARTETSTARIIPGIINKLNDIKNNLGPKGGS